MADTGTPWSLPYPLLTDPPNGPLSVQDLAVKTAGSLGYAYPCTSSTHPTNKPGLIISESDTGLLYVGDGSSWSRLHSGGDDTGWLDLIAEGFTAAANFTLNNGSVRRKFGVVGIYAYMTSTNAITAGDYSNTVFMTAPAGYIPAVIQGGLGNCASGNTQTMHVTTGGGFYLTAGQGIGAGSAFNCSGTYML